MGAEICESQRAGNPGRGIERNTCLSSDADDRDHNIKQIKHKTGKRKKSRDCTRRIKFQRLKA